MTKKKKTKKEIPSKKTQKKLEEMSMELTGTKTKEDAQDVLETQISNYDHRHDEARKYGKAIAKRLCEKYKAAPYEYNGKIHKEKGLKTDEASAAIAEILYHCYDYDESEGCGELLTQWTQEKLWGRVVINYIPKLKEVWQYLHDNKYTKKNTLGYGDIDGAIWVEYPRQEEKWEDERKIIIHTSHCTLADANTHIFILNESRVMGTTLHVRTVWPRQKVDKDRYWKDDRDVKIPSLNTYRDRNFKYSYQDGRDKGYVLTLDGRGTSKVEWAHHYPNEIQHALYIMDQMKIIITDESYQCK